MLFLTSWTNTSLKRRAPGSKPQDRGTRYGMPVLTHLPNNLQLFASGWQDANSCLHICKDTGSICVARVYTLVSCCTIDCATVLTFGFSNAAFGVFSIFVLCQCVDVSSILRTSDRSTLLKLRVAVAANKNTFCYSWASSNINDNNLSRYFARCRDHS